MSETTTIHLVRHGEVHNPARILYGRLPGYHLSELGRTMAERVADHLASHDVVHVAASPLERAQETAQPVAQRHGLKVVTDDRLIEAENRFEGRTFGVGDGLLRRPGHWRHLYHPFRPSWGEAYSAQAVRMLAAVADARSRAAGREAVLVGHQLPIWVTRCAVEGRRLWHDPRRRQCSLGSLTTLSYVDGELVAVSYVEPAADLLPVDAPQQRPGA